MCKEEKRVLPGLPWKKIQQRDEVMRCKEECRRGDRRVRLSPSQTDWESSLRTSSSRGSSARRSSFESWTTLTNCDTMTRLDECRESLADCISQVDYAFIYEVLKMVSYSRDLTATDNERIIFIGKFIKVNMTGLHRCWRKSG